MSDREELKQKANVCDVCNVSCSSALQLFEHVVGHKHKAVVKRVSPGSIPHVIRLQYFFDTYMKLEPVLGLEYVEETQRSSGYRYRCLLCGFQGDRKPAFLHITGAEHITKYVDKHHPQMSISPSRYPQKTEYMKALQCIVAKICRIYGTKRIVEIHVADGNDEGPPPQKVIRYSLDSKGDQHPSGGLSGFKGNVDFLDYLQKFEIRNEEDAQIIRRITQNCTQALVRYREEQARRTEPATSDRTNKGLNVGPAAPAPMSLPQTDATQLFFDSLKNMEESEVVVMLNKIATTNPAFRDINIPSVISYLQATGKLKAS